MPFINEKVSESDIEKYGLRDINKKYSFASRNRECKWTIDRERDIYLREMGSGREERCSNTTFSFYWKGHCFFVQLDLLASGSEDGHHTTKWGLLVEGYTNKGARLDLPAALEPMRESVLADFKEVMLARHAATFLRQPKSYSVEFAF